MTHAVLVLEDGRTFRGRSYGAAGVALGEAVFTTGMTGYQETITDPSYHRQVVVQTAPHIGNTGMNDEDPESRRIWVAGYVVRDPAVRASNWRATRELESDLVGAGVVGISGIDTRALTRHLRERGAMRVGIFSGDELGDPATMLDRVVASPGMAGADLTADVTTPQPYVVDPVGEPEHTVAAIDLGIKAMTPRRMAERGIRVIVLPATSSLSDVLGTGADGFFLSNGPGDPATADRVVELVRGLLAADRPVFGICFGNQIFGRALGLDTYKLKFGHRGINQPVKDLTTGKVEVTAHNHGFAVAAPGGPTAPLPGSAAPFPVPEPVEGPAAPVPGSAAPFPVPEPVEGPATPVPGSATPVPGSATPFPVPEPVEGPAATSPTRALASRFETDFGPAEVSHVCLNDDVVEGLRLSSGRAFSVQYHPEAAAGPHDAAYLFDRFREVLRGHPDPGPSLRSGTGASGKGEGPHAAA